MKNDKFFDEFGKLDDRYIEESAPDASLRRAKRQLWHKLGALAASISLIIGLNFWLFLPYRTTAPDVSRYSGNAYFEVIEKLNDFAFKPPKHKNNAHALSAKMSGFFNMMFSGGAGADDAPGDAPGSSGVIVDGGSAPDMNGSTGSPEEKYVEITDNQVAGVVEGDIIKRTTEYIFHLHANTLSIYSIAGEASDTVGEITLFPEGNIGFNAKSNELYLSEDCSTVTVVFSYYDYNKSPVRSLVDVISLDVTNPAEITETSRITLNGSINTSRLTSGELLILTNYTFDPYTIDFDNPKTYLPSFYQNGETTCIAADGIVCPTEVSTCRYTVITKLDQKTLKVKGAGAFLSYTEDAYITKTTVYATRPYRGTTVLEDGSAKTCLMTEIAAIDFSGDIKTLGSITLEGKVNNQYSLDEYNGILRVAASVSGTVSYAPDSGMDTGIRGYKNASLYCIDISDFSLRASVQRFCPEGEEVTSARFSGNTAYVCTANKQYFTDPVYMFDLSDLDNITYKDTGTIDGYSTSLTEFSGGFLLGIGVGEWQDTAKIEIYEEGESTLSSVAVFECYGTIASDYKCHFIDRENGFIGITVSRYAPKTHTGTVDSLQTAFVLLAFNGSELEVARVVPLEGLGSSAIFFVRAFAEDGYLYLVCDRGLKVISLSGAFGG